MSNKETHDAPLIHASAMAKEREAESSVNGRAKPSLLPKAEKGRAAGDLYL